MDHAIEMPSYVLVPRPSSSKSTSERGDMLFMMFADSLISTINVLSPIEILSLAPTRVKILSTTPMCALSAGTNEPICASNVMSAVWRSSADLPAIFGPVMMMICCESALSNTSLAMYSSPTGMSVSITGWRPCLMSSVSDSSMIGRTYLFSVATQASECRQSSVESARALRCSSAMKPTEYCTSSLKSCVSNIRMRSSAPRMRSSYSFNSCVM